MYIREEGGAYKTGLNITYSLHWKVPYFSLVWVSFDLGTGDVKKTGFRFRLWKYAPQYVHTNGFGLVFPEYSRDRVLKGPELFNYSASYNWLENELRLKDAILFDKTHYESYVEDRKQKERQLAREQRERLAYVEECKKNQAECDKEGPGRLVLF